jgi:hypothetical protein
MRYHWTARSDEKYITHPRHDVVQNNNTLICGMSNSSHSFLVHGSLSLDCQGVLSFKDASCQSYQIGSAFFSLAARGTWSPASPATGHDFVVGINNNYPVLHTGSTAVQGNLSNQPLLLTQADGLGSSPITLVDDANSQVPTTTSSFAICYGLRSCLGERRS